MKTPIADFVKEYIKSGNSRFHMPGHKGKTFLGCEPWDITEIKGADVLSEAEGIIGESEENASVLFGSRHSFYVTQGSTTAIYAMLALVKAKTGRTTILAARNAHKAFVNGCALLDYDVEWMMPEDTSQILKCEITGEMLDERLRNGLKPSAVYLTSPDYLGNIQNIHEISQVCSKYDVPCLVDNAHGAYLKFLPESKHPIDLGATVCCDSAHKTLPVLTGGAYMHISEKAPSKYVETARNKIALFSSTSPSYLVLQSLDLCNDYLENKCRSEIAKCISKVDELTGIIINRGFVVEEGEPLKITINAQQSGFSGDELAECLRRGGVEAEFYDKNYLVLMITPQNSNEDFERLAKVFVRLSVYKSSGADAPTFDKPLMRMSIREAAFSDTEIVNIKSAVGRICAETAVSCPPAVPIAVCGEEITENVIRLFEYYQIKEVRVVK